MLKCSLPQLIACGKDVGREELCSLRHWLFDHAPVNIWKTQIGLLLLLMMFYQFCKLGQCAEISFILPMGIQFK